jgi:phosphoribosylanthranilate isomerase
MSKVKVKICGITNLPDARAALKMGADFLGFVFAKSPRCVSVLQARKIIAHLPREAQTVGVFVNENVARLNRWAQLLGLKYVQLHGDESPAYCRKVKLPVIKALRIRTVANLKAVPKYKNVFAVLLDAYVIGRRGGTGRTFNWRWAAQARRYHKRIFLSGGLTAENVAAAVERVKPYAVDASSSLESYPGKKNRRHLRRFLNNAKIT